ncbi:Clathrin heavy chain 1 [Smittium mucronatum]|uniref:Clathrin heavy chain n=1 Tax=Smittium mucronatum TaxID=133383 RepID=A0A1R0GXL7_9FUNG|nr:Clathrin heavy chain 1 [Smittium mucronatum]
MNGQLPIELTEVASLTDLGVELNNINFNNVTLESDKFICIRELGGPSNMVNVIDLHNITKNFKRPITADSAIMNPDNRIIALRSERKLQVFNLELSAKVKACTISEDVVFWHWVNSFELLIVTTLAVYKWSIEGASDPVKQFLLHNRLKDSHIIRVCANKLMNWILVIGISEQNGRVVGTTQLFNKDKGVSQIIDAHAATFFEFNIDGSSIPTQALILASRDQNKSQMSIVEIDHADGAPTLEKRKVDIPFPPEAVNDFPVAVQTSSKFGLAYIITKYGFLHIYFVETGANIFSSRISGDTVFVSTQSNNGVLCINRKGTVLFSKINESTIIPHMLATNNDVETCFKLATRGQLSGADDLYVQRFHQMLANSNYMEAAAFAARSPNGVLRTSDTISRLKHLPNAPGQLSPILNYFATILETGELNKYEAIELTRPVLAMNRKQLLENWLKENKLECSEELGDIVYEHDVTLALSIYLRAGAHSKAIQCFAQLGQFDKITLYSQKTGFTPNWTELLSQAASLDADKARDLAISLVKATPPLISAESAATILMGKNLIPQTTSFLLDVLRDNLESDGPLQTKLLEMNLIHAPQVADAILSNKVFTHFDKSRIAQLCERANLYQRALELYTDIDDIKRVIVHTNILGTDWIVEYLSTISPENSAILLRDMLINDPRQNMQTVVQAATKYSDLIGSQKLISIFEETNCMEGLYYYLGSVVNTTNDPAVVFKYIQVATQIGQYKEVERVVRDNSHYDPEKVKNYLTEAQIPDQLPLIIVCDKYGFVNDLILHLYKCGHTKFIEVYVQQVNSSRLPSVVGALLDVDCDENVIKTLISTVNPTGFSTSELIDEVEKRGRLKMLHKWLESRAAEGSTEQSVYNGLAKLYIETNIEPEHFLRTNTLYDGLLIGSYCENRDPNLAFIAYSSPQSLGKTDKKLIDLAVSSSMFKQLSKYVLQRKDTTLWNLVLNDPDMDPISRKSFIDQVVNFGISDNSSAEEVSVAVKAFMTADLPSELIQILEKLLLSPTEFSNNSNLQNLLFITAIKADSSRVGGYINRLKNYDSSDIALICINNGLFEEAFSIYKSSNMLSEASGVLIDNIRNLDRAYEFAEQTDKPEVWSRLGKAQLNDLKIVEAISSYIRANDPGNYSQVIQIASKANKYNELIRFLNMARLKIREPVIESELLFAYASTDRLKDLEELVKGPNIAQIQLVGERCYKEKLYKAAKILFASISSWAQLASTLVMLEEYREAVECCKKANSTIVWRQVSMACIAKKEFRLAQICGLHLIVNAEELDPLVKMYESSGYIDELISLLENGLGLERAHMGLFTSLAILYAKYKPEEAMDFLKTYWSRINIPKVIKVCESVHLWCELVFLYVHYEDYDNGVTVMIEHSSDAFDHTSFKELISKVSNLELMYKAIRFYLSENPMLVNELLGSIISKLDLTRVVEIFVKSENTPLIKPFLEQVMQSNEPENSAVIEALHELYLECYDYNSLKASIIAYSSFDSKKLASKLSTHNLLEFRRIAVFLYNKMGMFNESLALSKKDRLYSDAIATANLSKDQTFVHDLLKYFVTLDSIESSNNEDDVGDCCFIACITVNNSIINPSYVMELAYKHGKSNIVMPYFINYTNNLHNQMNYLSNEVAQLKDLVTKINGGGNSANPSNDSLNGLGNRLMIGPGSSSINGNNNGGFVGQMQPSGYQFSNTMGSFNNSSF